MFAHEVPHAATSRVRYTFAWLIGGWIAAYVAATALQVFLVAAFDISEDVSRQPDWFLLAGALSLWIPQVVLLVVFSRRAGTGSFLDDFSFRFRVVDLWGVPIGVLSQVLLVGLVTWPFRTWFPDTFNTENVEDRARTLYDSARGPWLVVLGLIVVIGAPLVEELVYRGFLQAGLRSRINDVVAILITAAWFAGIHGRVAELPGLFAFALVLGIAFHMTRRLGMPVIAHLAFNATGLAFLALT
ncbi:MAG: CPBP family intramembrane metalloprotease [Ilumatobacteraceae bacterium]|nr:CPBP family intramembrane metalloprotease [Ilumatobacteraceae bacterium]